jgi:integrase
MVEYALLAGQLERRCVVSVVQRGKKLSLRGTIDKRQYTYATGKEATAINRRWLEKNKDREFLKLHSRHRAAKSGALFKDYGLMVIENSSSRRNGFTQGEIVRQFEKLCETFGEKAIQEIKASDIMRWQNTMLKKLSAKTVRNYRSVLSMVFKMAYADAIIDRNPIEFVEAPKQMKRTIETYTIEEVKRIIKVCEEPFMNFVQLMFFTGMRPGEMIALQWSDISFETGTIIVQRRRRDGVLDTTKSKKARVLDMLPQAREALLRQRKITGLAKEIFLTQYGKPYMETETFRRQFKAAAKKAGARVLRMYDMRHTFITIMAQSGMPESWIVQQVGHKDIGVTYDHYMGRVKADLSNIEKIAL